MSEPTRSSVSSGGGSLTPALISFELWTILLFVCSLAFHLVERLRRIGGYQAYPLSNDSVRFNDFTTFAYKFEFFHSAKFFQVGFPINYPAPCALFLEIFFRSTHHPLRAFVAFSILAFLVPALLFIRVLHRRGIEWFQSVFFVASITLFSWPVILLFDRGNVEMLVFMTVLVGLWAYATGRSWLAAAFFGLAASLKLFPFVLFGLYISRRQWSKVLFGAAIFLAVSVISLAILGPSIPVAFRGIVAGLASFKMNYMAEWQFDENGVDHSLFALYKSFMVNVLHHSHHFPNALRYYLTFTALSGITLYLVRIRILPLINQVLLLTISSIYLTAFSGDGTLIHLYAPLAMLFFTAIEAHRSGIHVPGLRLMLNLCVFILSITTFLIHHSERFIGQAKGIALGILFLAALVYPLGPPLSETLSESILSEPDLRWLTKRRPV